ncbi:hypothetical protein ACP4OV_013991 [Aristida adscensionis]
MNPNGLPTNAFGDSQAYNLPLHEVRRGTIALPLLSPTNSTLPCSTLPGYNMLDFHAPHKPNMILASGHSLPNFNSDISAPPPHASHVLAPAPAPAPPTSTTSRFMESMMSQQEILSSQHKLQAAPVTVSEYLNYYDQMHTLSRDPSLMASFHQREPTTFAQSHLSINGVPDQGPIFKNPSRYAPKVHSQSPRLCFLPKSQQSLATNYMKHGILELGSSSYEDYDGTTKFSLGPFLMSHNAPSYGNTRPNKRFGVASEEVQREYTCKACKISFSTPQALGGHRSSHSKALKKKKNLNASSYHGAAPLLLVKSKWRVKKPRIWWRDLIMVSILGMGDKE